MTIKGNKPAYASSHLVVSCIDRFLRTWNERNFFQFKSNDWKRFQIFAFMFVLKKSKKQLRQPKDYIRFLFELFIIEIHDN